LRVQFIFRIKVDFDNRKNCRTVEENMTRNFDEKDRETDGSDPRTVLQYAEWATRKGAKKDMTYVFSEEARKIDRMQMGAVQNMVEEVDDTLHQYGSAAWVGGDPRDTGVPGVYHIPPEHYALYKENTKQITAHRIDMDRVNKAGREMRGGYQSGAKGHLLERLEREFSDDEGLGSVRERVILVKKMIQRLSRQSDGNSRKMGKRWWRREQKGGKDNGRNRERNTGRPWKNTSSEGSNEWKGEHGIRGKTGDAIISRGKKKHQDQQGNRMAGSSRKQKMEYSGS
jgi:hypothetical protein